MASSSQGTGKAGKQTWEDMVLADLGAPQSTTNEIFLRAWELQEGGQSVEHINNPLNTKLDRAIYPGYSAAPGIPVYPDLTVGSRETARTLQSGYPSILNALRTDTVMGQIGDPGFIGDLNRWVSGKRNPQPTQYTSSIAHNFAVGAGQGSAADWTSYDLGNAASDANKALGNPLGFIGSTEKALKFLFSLRFLEILGGGLLILLGLYLLGKQFGVSVPAPAPAKAAANAVEA